MCASLTDLSQLLDLLEGRLTILERQVERMIPVLRTDSPTRRTGDVVQFPCDHPGIVYSHAFPIEADEQGRKFCWLGNEDPVQIILPVAPTKSLSCFLLISLQKRA